MTDERELTRVPTGVPGLDEVLRGGLFAGGVYIVRGTPGAGKTILANQMCVHHAQGGGRALFVTLLAESHARMMQHMERLDFYDESLVPSQLYYVSGFRTLEEEGLAGLMKLLRREMRDRQATLLILDGLLAVEETSGSDWAFRKFIHEFQAYVGAEGCTALLLTNGSRAEYHPEHTMVDGLIVLEDVRYERRKQREIEVLKFRGSAALRGRHPFRITDGGLEVYPRVEARFSDRNGETPSGRMSTGIEALDDMMSGGPVVRSATLVFGATGSGKTTIGTHFLARSSAEEPGLHFGFYETPNRLIANAAAVGLDLQALVDAGHLELIWHAPTEQVMDDLGGKLIDAVKRRGVRRLFIDGLNAFAVIAEQPERLASFFTALLGELRALGVTTVITAETPNLLGPNVRVPVEGISALVDNTLLLRLVELRARLYRAASVLKVRGGAFDPRLREFRITDQGVVLADTLESAESILTGFGTERPTAGENTSAKSPELASSDAGEG